MPASTDSWRGFFGGHPVDALLVLGICGECRMLGHQAGGASPAFRFSWSLDLERESITPMARATATVDAQGKFYCWLIFCPACLSAHGPNEGWSFNGDFELPTFSPSILVKSQHGTRQDGSGSLEDGTLVKTICHSFVTAGRIQFLADCTHALAGQTVDLPDEFANDFDTAPYLEEAERLRRSGRSG